MPQLGETVTEGTITRWFKQVGDRVEADEPLFEVSTDKVDSEVPAPGSGVLAEILVPEGETVDVGTRLAVVSDSAASAPPAQAQPAEAAPTARAEPAQAAPTESAPAAAAETPETAQPPQPAPSAPFAPTPTPATPPPAAPPAPPAPAREPAPAAASAAPVAPNADGNTLVMSPVVRRLITERGLDPGRIKGTGEGGRITRRDVLSASAAPTAPSVEPPTREVQQAAPAPGPATPAAPAAPVQGTQPAATARGDEVVPFDNIRRRTAEHMVRSKATSAHVYTSIEVDYERVERARRAHRDEWKQREGFSLTYLPFIARAFCDAVVEFPNVNASVDGERLIVHHDIHLGIAVDLSFAGLIAPVVRNADGKRLRLLAREMRDLAERARAKQLSPDEVLGGTFTITNAGGYGTLITLPIINQPQVAILSTDGVHKRPVVVEGPDGEDAIAIRPVGVLALAWDHRAFDGAYAAAFLRRMKEILETRDWEAELT
ncbi:MAG: 2-oxo acid dehydrogenase subunit E2 [Actinobacteria bacterium]|nr:2-oxo acid dehydrogenase subunit E2 [Actinomycetota bacterium]